ncbi:hypothetical protein M422DRAFT_264305 [Sphaerobolus stellatus SS14]|uniref:DUF659 domain-containing protein n=1 Tax=Sphaerobolus stellatus (strain SS14) TaxID=990650 RepID=A0A0C9V8N0_SPHS4|nr:hypothetical protein M422DRAFT_264305 [Sphaerobolus stellatus SS14]
MFTLTKENVKQYHMDVDGKIHIIVDGWTSSEFYLFLGITIQYVHNGHIEAFILKSTRLLEGHTSEYLAEMLAACLQDYGIAKKSTSLDIRQCIQQPNPLQGPEAALQAAEEEEACVSANGSQDDDVDEWEEDPGHTAAEKANVDAIDKLPQLYKLHIDAAQEDIAKLNSKHCVSDSSIL